jgi:hypothetical protein
MEEQALLDNGGTGSYLTMEEQALLDNGGCATESSLGEVLPVALLKESSLHLHNHTRQIS